MMTTRALFFIVSVPYWLRGGSTIKKLHARGWPPAALAYLISGILFMTEPSQLKELNVVLSFPVFSKICHQLTNNTGKLETMPGTGRREGDLRVLRVQIDNEMAVRGVGKHTGGKAHSWAAPARKIAGTKG